MIVGSGIVATLPAVLAAPVWRQYPRGDRVSHLLRRVGAVTRSRRELAAVEDTGAQRRRSTSTSAFGVSRRENHDASGFYGRFVPPILDRSTAIHGPFGVKQPYRLT